MVMENLRVYYTDKYMDKYTDKHTDKHITVII